MPHSLEAEVFLSRIAQLPDGPGVSLDALSEQARDEELELRRLFATERTNVRLADIHAGLVDVFEAPMHARTTRARVFDDRDANLKFVEPLPDSRRRKEGTPATVVTLEEFRENWATFTENLLSDIDWSNIIAAGESVSACILPRLGDEVAIERAEYFHEVAYRECDIQLFLWGLTSEEAHNKIISIFKAIRRTIRPDAICVRMKDSIAIHIKYPYRTVRFPLQLYKSPAEVLAALPIDSDCCAFDGTRVFGNPRALIAMIRQCNTVDATRVHSLYEIELLRRKRAFEIYVPMLDRSKLDTAIYERPISTTHGLARLLAMEESSLPYLRNTYIANRVQLRSRPIQFFDRRRKDEEPDKGDYGIAEIAVKWMPYGPRWDVNHLSKWIREQYSPPEKSKKHHLHRHSAFVYTKMDNCFEDGCGNCPVPENGLEREMQADNDKLFVRGAASFIPDTGSIHSHWNNRDTSTWSRTAHLHCDEAFFASIAAGDGPTVTAMILDGADINARDCAGRTPLHVAILTGHSNIACDLVDAGVRISAKLIGGQTALHLATRMAMIDVVHKLLERSRQTAEASGVSPSLTRHHQPPTEEEGDDYGMRKAVADFPTEDDDKGPDLLHIDQIDADNGLTPLGYAIMVGSLPMVDALLTAGANPKFISRSNERFQPLALTTVMYDEDCAVQIAERLIRAGATSSAVDNGDSMTIFHRAVAFGHEKLAAALLRLDHGARTAVNVSAHYEFRQKGRRFVPPLVSAIKEGKYSLIALLLAYGARLSLKEVPQNQNSDHKPRSRKGSSHEANHTPLEMAICTRHPIAELLIRAGANVNALPMLADSSHATLVEWVSGSASYLAAVVELTKHHGVLPPQQILPPTATCKEYLENLVAAIRVLDPRDRMPKRDRTAENRVVNAQASKYYAEIEAVLREHQAKTWQELHPDERYWSSFATLLQNNLLALPVNEPGYLLHSHRWGSAPIMGKDSYDQLYEACWSGDDAKILSLCLPKTPSPTSLEISVTTTSPTDRYSQAGYTPLSIAVQARKWDTARLIVVICAAQCQGREDLQDAGSQSTVHPEPVPDATAPYTEEPEPEAIPVDLSEVATRKFKALCVGTPAIMLRESHERWLSEDGRSVLQGSLVERTIIENDIDAFKHVLDLHQCLSVPVSLDPKIALWAIEHDRPAMLDEYIRRTGYGLGEIEEPTAPEPPKGPPVHRRAQDYRGWRRKPMDYGLDAKDEKTLERPIVWQAIKAGAAGVLEYMASPQPLAAIREHISSTDGFRARNMLKIIEDEDELSVRWGWKANDLNESALTVAILCNRLDMIEKLFKLAPEDMILALNARLRLSHFNAILLAAYTGCSPALVDYLMDKESDVHALDVRGWNVYHLVCISAGSPHQTLLDHLLKRLPADLSRTLLAQQSENALNTPLHLACRRQRTAMIQSLLDSGLLEEEVFLTKDANGSTPLHAAILMYQDRAISALAAAGPAEALHIENGVGDTPLEAAFQKYLHSNRISPLHLITEQLPAFGPLVQLKARPDDQLPGEVIKLRTTVTGLLEEGTLVRGTRLADELLAFTQKMETEWQIPTPSTEPGARSLRSGAHQEAARRVYALVKEAVASRPAARGMLRTVDAQDLFQKALHRYRGEMSGSGRSGGYAAYAVRGQVSQQEREDHALAKKSVLVSDMDPFRPSLHEPRIIGARGVNWIHGGDDF
ncbi:ankyrin [Artomyces pyxidatus]|uniref:Ankyrin n=1 Tax=Artomyces pyxidatus TaxID=48021 RepID=A0ACB8SU56_9AGAM|nr:ankyrin [Artomyces pyxidatus]